MKLNLSRVHIGIILSIMTILGVGMIALSNSSALPDPFDPPRPQDTWQCCMSPAMTANIWRWPLFITGTVLLLGVAIGTFLARRQPSPQPSSSQAASRWQRLGHYGAIGCIAVIGLLTLFLVAAYLGISSGHTVSGAAIQAIIIAGQAYLWITFVAVCCMVPWLTAWHIGHWVARVLVALYTIIVCWFLVSWIAPNHYTVVMTHGHYPLDILIFNRAPVYYTTGWLPIITSVYWIAVSSIILHHWRKTRQTQPASSDTPS